jgi:urea transporter
MGCIILNTLVLLIKWTNAPEIIETTTEIINYILAGIFTIEAAVKIIGLGHFYFQDSWNNFDFSIVCGTILGIILNSTTGFSVGP